MSSAPISHQQDALKLTADAYVELFEFTFRPSGKMYLKKNNDAIWQGRTWEGIGIQLSGVGQSAGEEISRPRLAVVNPNGIFSAHIVAGRVDRATMNRYRVLKTHFDNDTNIYRRQTWMISRVISMNSKLVQMELRELSDGPNTILPARVFAPPEFPVVSIR